MLTLVGMVRRRQQPAQTQERRAVLYARVSTAAQAAEGVSLAAQRVRAEAWALANGYSLAEADIHVDAGLSGGRADNRPGLQAALRNACRDGSALVVYSLSRLARSVADTMQIANRLEATGADLVSLSESIDTTSAAGKMVFRMLAVLAEFERDLVSERTMMAMGHLKAQGEYVGGKVPFGSRLVAGRLEALEDELRIVRAARALRAQGLSLRSVAARLGTDGHNSRTGRAFAPVQIARMLEEKWHRGRP